MGQSSDKPEPEYEKIPSLIEKNIYPMELPSGRIVYPPKGRSWLYSKERFEELYMSLKDVDLTKVIEEVDNTDLSGEVACANGVCELV
jgi:hypothetical protein